jgi:hypothetical protein
MSRFTSPDFLRQAGDKHVRATPPPPVDLTSASITRLHSFHLKGKDHFEVDRDLATRAERAAPGFVDIILGERAFLQRAVRHLAADLGIRQFLQVGAGLPAPGDPHEIARESIPDARVVYASDDPVVLAHHLALIRDGRTTTAVQAGLNDTFRLLHDPESSLLLDLDQPIGLLLTGVVAQTSGPPPAASRACERPWHPAATWSSATTAAPTPRATPRTRSGPSSCNSCSPTAWGTVTGGPRRRSPRSSTVGGRCPQACSRPRSGEPCQSLPPSPGATRCRTATDSSSLAVWGVSEPASPSYPRWSPRDRQRAGAPLPHGFLRTASRAPGSDGA